MVSEPCLPCAAGGIASSCKDNTSKSLVFKKMQSKLRVFHNVISKRLQIVWKKSVGERNLSKAMSVTLIQPLSELVLANVNLFTIYLSSLHRAQFHCQSYQCLYMWLLQAM